MSLSGALETAFGLLAGATGICVGWLGLAGILEEGHHFPRLRSQWTLLAAVSLWFSGGALALVVNHLGEASPATFKAEAAFLGSAAAVWLLALAVGTAGFSGQADWMRRTSLQEEAAAVARQARPPPPAEGHVAPGDYERERVM